MAENPIKTQPLDLAWSTWGGESGDIASAFNNTFNSLDRISVTRNVASVGYGGYGGYGGRGFESRYGGGESTGYRDVEGGHDVRPGFDRSDYDYYRPGEAVPYTEVERLACCNRAYNKIGIIKQMIDLMGDFGSKGIAVNHKVPRIQKILRSWFSKVNAPERSERFLNLYYRLGTTIIKRTTTEISGAEITNLRKMLLAPAEDPDDDEIPSLAPNTKFTGSLPTKYTFLNPICVEHEDYEIASLVQNPQLRMRLKPSIIDKINKISDEQMVIKNGFVYLNKSDMYLAYYKKDDWKLWGTSLIEPILDDIVAYEKLRLADLAALDSVISKIRIWKLGNLENKIVPQAAAFTKLSRALASNTGGGAIDIVWTPDIDLLESKTDTHQFLGSEKYKTVLSAIYGGLGVPASLTGESQAGGTSSNSLIQLKTVTERLNYGRNALTEFWMGELRRVCDLLGVKTMPTISYDCMVLQDDVAIKGLLNQLVDRNIISEETIQERYGENPELETTRLRREHKKRMKNPKLPQKTGPWNNPERLHDIIRIALQTGYLSKSDLEELYEVSTNNPIKVAVDGKLEEKKQVLAAKSGGGTAPAPIAKAPAGTNGRPRGKKDTTQRKSPSIFSYASIREYVQDKFPNQEDAAIDLAAMSFYIGGENLNSVSSVEEIIKKTNITEDIVTKAREVLGLWKQ